MRALRNGRGLDLRAKRTWVAIGLLASAVVVAVGLPTASGANKRVYKDVHATKAFWHGASLKVATGRHATPALHLRSAKVPSFTLDRHALAKILVKAPLQGTRAARLHPLVVTLPAPNGAFQRFALTRSQVMAPGLAAKHRDISTYYGRGIDDRRASIAADVSHIGFHAAVRSSLGSWYIDPYFRNDQSRYISYFGSSLKTPPAFVEKEPVGATKTKAAVGTRVPTGDVTRTYRLALMTDPGYSDYVGGPANVTAAKVALINRVSQVYHDDLSIQLQLIGNNDLLNLNTWGAATAPNGPCGAAACFTQSQVTGCSSLPRNRIVAGQIVGASAYDIGHLALGQPGGGVANLGVVGRAAKAQGCTGIPTPIGDFYAIDYVAHEMGHQFSGNHPFNGNQLNCSGGNRSAGTSVEPGSGSSIMAYAGICLTDDLQPHSDPYFSERSLSEISTYTSGNQAAINEVQSAALRHFGGGSEVQTVTFGPGYQRASTIQPLTVAIGAAPSATQMGGATEDGNTVTIATGASGATHTLQPGDSVTIAGVPVAGYNGTWTVATVPSSRSFTYTNPTSGLGRTGGGTITLNAPGLTESGTTVTARTSAAHGRSVGELVVITGAGVGAYNGTVTITAVPTARSFQYTAVTPATTAITTATNATGTIASFAANAHGLAVGQQVTIAGVSVGAYNGTWTVASVPNGNTFTVDVGTSGNGAGTGGTATGSNANLPNSGAGTVTYSSPFQVRIGGNDSAVIGGGSQTYTTANVQNAINAISGFAGTVTVSGLSSTGFTLTYGGASAGLDVPNAEIVNLSCGGCFGSNEETNHGGANDSFTLNYNGTVSAPIVNGTNYTAAGISAAMTSILPAGATATVAGFGGGTFNNQGFQVTYTGTLAATNVSVMLGVQDFTAGASGFVNELDKGGPVDNKGGIVATTTNSIPAVTAPAAVTIPIRTPFALTGSATDADGDALIYAWEQNDRGGTAGTALMNNTKVDGPLFAMFPKSAPITEADTLLYNSPHENHLTGSPTRVFPDMQQILDNNTNADTGACPTGPIAPPASIPVRECYSEFLPTAAYLGSTAAGNAAPARLNMRFTARDNKGGTNNADTVLTIAPAAGPFLVTSSPSSLGGAQPATVTWNVANTDTGLGTSNVSNVKISLSTDGGQTFPAVLAASTPNDGSQSVTIPNTGTTQGRLKVEALGNVFFDVNNADFTIAADSTAPTTTASLSPASPNGLGGWYLNSVQVTLSATDSESGVASTSYSVDGGPTQSYSGPFTVSGSGTHTVSYWSSDNAGNTETAKSTTIRIDLNTPTSSASISPPPQNGWYASPTVTLTGNDGVESGIDHIDYSIDGGVSHVYTGPLSGFTTGNHYVEFKATDVAGRVEPTMNLVAFKADSGIPSVTITRPAIGGDYKLNQVVKANYKCADPRGGSGLASCVGTVPFGSPINTATVGDHVFTVTATDRAGNTRTVNRSYHVRYAWQGFFSPISNTGSSKLNLVHAGDLIRLGFGLDGNRGTAIFASGFPTSVAISCPAWPLHSIHAAPGGAGLSYVPASGHYQYGWQTNSAWAGTCRRFQLQLNDGTGLHTADFMFFS